MRARRWAVGRVRCVEFEACVWGVLLVCMHVCAWVIVASVADGSSVCVCKCVCGGLVFRG